MRGWRWVLTATSAAAIGGCAAQPQYFEPTERVEGRTLEGFEAAFYQLQGPTGDFGQAKLWSTGAVEGKVDGVPRTIIEVHYQIQNRGSYPVSVDARRLALRTVETRSGRFQNVPAAGVTGDTTISPGAVGEGFAIFTLPPEVKPTEVVAFNVRWSVEGGPQRYSDLTPFTQVPSGVWYTPAYYDPFWGWGPYGDGLYGYGYGPGLGYYGVAYPPVVPSSRTNRPTIVRSVPR
jgi:hypothetical protein